MSLCSFPIGLGSITLPAPVTPTAWAPSTAYNVGDRVRNVDSSGNTRVYECIVAGTSAGSVGPTFGSGTGVDGTVTWKIALPALPPMPPLPTPFVPPCLLDDVF